MKISHHDRNKIAREAAAELTKGNPDILATACPLCKKTFASATGTRVADIAEIVAEAIILPQPAIKSLDSSKKLREPANIS